MNVALLDRHLRRVYGVGPTKTFALADAESCGLRDLPPNVAEVEARYSDPLHRFAFVQLSAEEVSQLDQDPGVDFASLDLPERRLPPEPARPAVLCPVLVHAAADPKRNPPGPHALAHLLVGDHVRLGAWVKHNGASVKCLLSSLEADRVIETFWVRITQIITRTETEDPLVVGPIGGQPAVMHGVALEGCTIAPISRGDVVAFDRRNVLAVA